MARAPNPGAPQRVSAHVVPKASSFPAEDDEKTTIESGGWEEEASTTVEQGEVADKLRALGIGESPRRTNTGITSTTGSGVSDEPTVDDQRASAALAMLPPPSIARLVITAGNDTGRLLEIRPGKTYTIGRGIDNDLVLSDIAVSRKHFDIRNENGSWILADRGSGNGTLVNNRIEDAPFLLASGDAIEVGNTAFRFDLVTAAISLPGLPYERGRGGVRDAPASGSGRDGVAAANGIPGMHRGASDSSNMPTPSDMPPPRELAAAVPGHDASARELAQRFPQDAASAVPTYDPSADDDLELSTVSGKPMDDDERVRPAVTASRPKTLPPPSPTRPRTQAGRPPLGHALDRTGPRSQPMAIPPQPQHPPLSPSALAAAMAPTISPMHPAPMLHLPQPATTLPLPQMANRGPLSPALLDPSLGALPATIPGQGPPAPVRGPRLPFSYPSAPDMRAGLATGGGHPPLYVAAGHPGRDAPSTAQVHPMSYSGHQVAVAPQPAPREVVPISRRAKLALGAIGLIVFAAIATVAIIRGLAGAPASAPAPGDKSSAARPPAAPVREPAVSTREPAAAPKTRSVTITPLSAAPPRPTDRTASPTTPPRPPASGPVMATPSAPPIRAPGPSGGPSPGPERTPASGKLAATPPPSVTPPSVTPPSVTPIAPTPSIPTPTQPSSAPATQPPPKSATPAAPAATPPRAVVAANDKTVAPAAPPTAAARPASDTAPSVATSPRPRTDKATPPEVAPATPARTANASDKRTAKHIDTRKPDRRPPEVAPPPPPRPAPDKRRPGKGTQDVKADASALYKAKNFTGAATLLTSSLSGFSGDDAKELRSIAGIYQQLGKAYNIGMAPGTRPTEAYQALRRAIDFDHEVGSSYVPELQAKLVVIASRAASSYMAAHEYELAFQAVRTAESLGSTSSNNKTVRTMLEDIANDLYREGASDLSSDPDGAKKKLRQILGIVEIKNPLYGRAQKLLNAP